MGIVLKINDLTPFWGIGTIFGVVKISEGGNSVNIGKAIHA